MSKDLFMQIRELELSKHNQYPTKKDIQSTAKTFVKQRIDKGETNIIEDYSQIVRIKEAINTIEAELKKSLKNESFEAFGIKASYRSGGNTINYEDDPVYCELKNKLTQRAELLETALKSDAEIYDNEGILVPKVSTTPRKESLAITF